ncbi:MAG: TonB-dependent receptor [Bacteroidales bacterium]|nr:TonB-dependent receptor [Bacteroidales bacterium]
MVNRIVSTATLALTCITTAVAGIIEGTVTDAETGELLIGASVTYAEGKGMSTDIDGRYRLDLSRGQYKVTVRYMGYKTIVRSIELGNGTKQCNFELKPDNTSLANVTVVGEVRRNTEAAATREQQEAQVAMTSVSEQHIKRTQDKNAGEVIRRIPGVSIIDEKFVMVRGLSQRYNNVWMNGSAVPSSEADQRAFSFDIIPSSQLNNMKVIKTAAPDYPADFTGGFIIVNTKDVPTDNTWDISLGGGYNDQTHLHDYLYYQGSATDWLGHDSGKRDLANGVHTTLKQQGNGYAIQDNGLNNDWLVRNRRPMPDMSLSGSVAHRWQTEQGQTYGLNGSVSYGHSNRTLTNMRNNLFGAYDQTHDCSNYLRQATDCQYTDNVRLGALLGLVWLSPGNDHHIELKQIFNQIGKSRYTYRRGYDAQSDYTEQAEYYYQSRLTYNAGMTGKHTLTERDWLDWNAGYAYANRYLPDRKRYTVVGQEDGTLEVENLNDINREFSYLNEHIYSAAINWKHDLRGDQHHPTLKLGLYGEMKNRKYDTRFFTYAWPNGQLPQELRSLDVPTQLLTDPNYGADGLYLLEQVDWTNNYEASQRLRCCYAALLWPLMEGRLEAYGGVRFESSHTELTSHTRRQQYSPLSTDYDYNDLFPSLNLTYHLTQRQQCRLAYGRTTNRPEFRELSTSVYYDFDLASNVQGNHNLRAAYIDNIDLGWEWYPNAGEVINVSLFYKHFRNPIEWTYTVAGGTDLIYSYINANGANNYGIELDVRRQLGCWDMPEWSVSINAALIQSKVDFAESSREEDRPMQGQSPYLINAGLFYNSDLGHPTRTWQRGWTIALLYNTIGKRIIGVGRSIGNADTDVRVPDSYEMPRHLADINIGKTWGHVDLRLSMRDLLRQKVRYVQFENSQHGEIEQVTRSFRPGRTISLSISYKMK